MIHEFPMPQFIAERRARKIRSMNPKVEVRVLGSEKNCFVEVTTVRLAGRNKKIPAEYIEVRGLRQGRRVR